MRWYLEASGDTRGFWDARFDGANVMLTQGVLDGETRTEALEFDSFDAAVSAMRAQARELMDAGYRERVPPEERYTPDPRIARFWREELLGEWQAMGVERRAEPTDYRDLWASYLATELPAELDEYLRWRSEYAFGYCNYGEWRIWDADVWLPRAADGNLFEQLVLADQENYLGTAMMEHFAGLVYIGSAGNGDGYYAHPNFADPGQVEVIFFDHETHSPDFAIADSLSSLAWLNHCYNELQDDDFDRDTFVADFGLLAERVQLSWHYSDLSEEAELEPTYADKSRARYQFYRAIWLDHLLRPDRADVDQIGNLFYADIHAALQFEDAERSPYLTSSPVTALYWLWRLWWFKRPELGRCLELVANHASPIARDCAALIAEIEAGRKQLGAIADMHARREAFLALDLDPDRAEARAAEEAAAAREAELNLASKLEAAHRVIGGGSVDEVREALWEFNDQDEVLDVLYEHLATVDPEVGPWLRRWAFLRDGGATRDGRHYAFEVAEVREVIRRAGHALAPRLARPAQVDDLAAAAALAGERVKPRLLEALEATDKYRRGVVAAAKGLARLGAAEAVPRMAALLAELGWEPGDFIAEIERKDAVLALIEALGELGGATARDALVAVIGGELDKVKPRALVALGRVGDPAAVPAIAPFLKGEIARPAQFALAWIGTADARDALAEHLAVLAGSEVELAYEKAMSLYASRDAAGAIDWSLAERLTRVVEASKYDDREMHETLARLLVGHPDRDGAVRILTDYLHHERHEVRGAAIESLRALDALPELRWLDRPTVDALFEAEGVAGLRAALEDPLAMFRHNALRKAVDEGVGGELAAQACALAEFYSRFDHYTNGWVRDAHEKTHYVIEALAAVGTEEADRLLCRMWRGPNALYREADTLKYNRENIQERLQRFVAEVDAEWAKATSASMPVYHAVTFYPPAPWVFGGCVNGMAWAPGGDVAAVCGEGGVRLYDTNGAVVRSFAAVAAAWTYDVDFNPDGTLLAAGAHAGHLWLLDPASGEVVAKLFGHGGVPNGVRKVRFSPRGKLLASASSDRTMRVWDVATRECVAVWEDPADVNTVDWVDEETLVIGTDRMIRLVTVAGEERASRSVGGVAEVRVDHERARIYVGSAKKLLVYSLELEEQKKAHLPQAAVARVRWRGDVLFAASWEGKHAGVVRWDLGTRKSLHLAGSHTPIYGMDLHPQTLAIHAGGQVGSIERWDIDGAPLTIERMTHTREIAAIRFADDEVLTAADDGTVVRWSSEGEALGVVRSPRGRLCDTAMDRAEGRLYVTGPRFAGCFDLAGELIWQAEPERSEHLALATDAVVVASGSALWWLDRATGALVHSSDEFADSFIFFWARLDARRIAVAGYDDERVFVWDIESRELLATWELPAAKRGGICAMKAADRLYLTRWDKTLLVLDAQDGTVLTRLALADTKYPIAVREDGRRICLHGGVVSVLDGTSLEEIAAIDAGAKVEEMEFAADGRLFFGNAEGGLLVVSGLD